MGNASTKESRTGDAGHRGHHQSSHDAAGGSVSRSDRGASSRRNRVSRGDLSLILGLSSGAAASSQPDQPQERRETRQEREARRLERERLQRIAERERSMSSEHVDGGFLVTMGVYNSPEDFNKGIVRQLQIERKLAPFWRGLNDWSDQWTEAQIIAAARGLPIPPPDAIPPEDLVPRPTSPGQQEEKKPNVEHLTIPIGERTQSISSDQAHSAPSTTLPSPVAIPPGANAFLKPRGKAIASVLGSNSRNGSTTEFMPREIQLPHDPFVNGQPIEVFLYKNAIECPICFLTYPPYLNHTRCCDQPICSECFVQIKRPDPHFPEGHNENDPNQDPEEAAGLLVSEPACCPYCTQPNFGVTYEPPPFRRGLVYATSPSALGTASGAMSSSSSVNSANPSPVVGSPSSVTGRRRNQSLSANDANVILTDRIRPEWAAKLQAARAHQARRAAAATALHTAAFLMNNTENRGFRSRLGRRHNSGSGSGSAGATPAETESGDTPSQSAPEPTIRYLGRAIGDGGHRRTRIEDLEEMMIAEAVRLSIAAEEERRRKAEKEEEERRRKAEKEEKKAAKKKEKEERKAAKKQSGPYEGPSGQSSASASSLSLPGLHFGRKRGNSGASNLRIEASTSGSAIVAETLENADKGKGKGVDRGNLSLAEVSTSAGASSPQPIPNRSAGPSHLRQMSNASSVPSSILDSQPGSYVSPSSIQEPHGSGLSLGSQSGVSEDGGDHSQAPAAGVEPAFNFRSLAEVVDAGLDNAGQTTSKTEGQKTASEFQNAEANKDIASAAAGNVGQQEQSLAAPTVMVTSYTPGASSPDVDSKQAGYDEITSNPVQQSAQ